MLRELPVPMVVGHEFVGQITKVGSNVNDFHPGEIVSGEGHVVCGRCRNCMAGRRHLCAHSIGLGVQRPGALSHQLLQRSDQQVLLERLDDAGCAVEFGAHAARAGLLIQQLQRLGQQAERRGGGLELVGDVGDEVPPDRLDAAGVDVPHAGRTDGEADPVSASPLWSLALCCAMPLFELSQVLRGDDTARAPWRRLAGIPSDVQARTAGRTGTAQTIVAGNRAVLEGIHDFEDAIGNSPYSYDITPEHIQTTTDIMVKTGVGRMSRPPLAKDWVKTDLLEQAKKSLGVK